jgi:RNA polymerase sigma factor (sigma-70 family)
MKQVESRPGSAMTVGELYALHAGRLRRIVRSSVRAPEAVIEDACQAAWSRLVAHAASVRPEARLSWLVTTASREAIKLRRRAERDLSLDALVEDDVAFPRARGADELVALRERLGAVRALPLRQQRLVWLAGLGFSYVEMAEQTRQTRRTVERQLLRAKHVLGTAA